MTSDEILKKLEQIPIFSDLRGDHDSMSKMLDIIRKVHYPADRVIIREGDVGAEMYIIYSGTVEICKRTRAGDNYTVTRLDAIKNVFFGELALIDDENRSATVVTLSDSEFLVISKRDFVKLGNAHPHIALPITRSIAQILAGRLRKTTADMLTIFDALLNELSE